MTDLSIVFGTFDRLKFLRECIDALRLAVGNLSYEIIVIDGGSKDGTLDYLYLEPNIFVIEHGALLGCVKAYNDGFAVSSGEFVAYLNDDLILPPNMLKAAVDMLKQDSTLGMIALRYYNPGNDQPEGSYGTCKWGDPLERVPYANFGVLRRELGNKVGWFGDYFHYAGDIHLSFSVWNERLKVVPLNGYRAHHYLADNFLRGEERWDVPDGHGKSRRDGEKFHQYWDNWRWNNGNCIPRSTP